MATMAIGGQEMAETQSRVERATWDERGGAEPRVV